MLLLLILALHGWEWKVRGQLDSVCSEDHFLATLGFLYQRQSPKNLPLLRVIAILGLYRF